MNCYVHTDQAAVAYCRSCGRGVCQACQRVAQGTVFCADHAPVQETVRPVGPPSSQPGASSPGLAFVLGMIPGVGAIYNGQYVKGLVHVIVFGTLVSILSSGAAEGMEPLFGLITAVWFFYMAFEAYHTASKRLRGQPVDEFSSLVPLKTGRGGFPVGPVVVIAVGIVFLLSNLGFMPTRELLRYGPPVFLIVLGVYMLYTRLTGAGVAAPQNQEAEHGQ